MKNNQNKVAVVTGASGTLCSVLAKALAQQGYDVALIGRSKEKLADVAQEVEQAGQKAVACSADVTDYEAMRAAYETIKQAIGPCSVLINGAGGNQMEAVTTVDAFNEQELSNQDPDFRGFLNLKMDRFQNVLAINTMGTVIPCQLFAPDMIEQGGGSIINFSSMNSFRPLSRVPAYAMAKAAIDNFTQWLAAYLASAGIRVNSIAPGFFINSRNKARLLTEDGGFTPRGEHIIRQTPMKRFGEASELIGTMNWLIDEEASGFVTGIVIPVDGGFLTDAGV